MNLLTPLGLIALIGLPIIIIIYILKPKYQEKTINSTYIWRLSLRYKKRKIPLSWLKRSLLLIVQLLIMSILAFMIAQPFLKHPKPQFERIIILDASASMMAVDKDGKTRFEKAKSAIMKDAEESSQEFDLSIILCDQEPDWLVQNVFSGKAQGESSATTNAEEQKAIGIDRINYYLSKTECTNQPCDYAAAMKLAEEYRQSHPDAKVVLYTDKTFSKPGYVTVENFAGENEWNASILSVEELAGGNETLYFEVTVGSFMKTGSLMLNAEITGVNGYEEGPLSTITFQKEISFNDDEPVVEIVRGEKDTIVPGFDRPQDMRIVSYNEAKFFLTTSTGAAIGDNYKYDNEYYCFGSSTELFNARVEIDQPANITTNPYVLTALQVSGNLNATEVSDKMKEQAGDGQNGAVYQAPAAVGFDLYVYDGRMPNILPDDGAIWIVNPPTNWNLSSQLGITIGNQTGGNAMLGIDLAVTQEESSIVKNLALFKTLNMLRASKYRPITVSAENPYNFKTILTIEGNPVMIAGENAQGVRMVITSLDMRYTDMPVSAALAILAQNVVDNTVSYTLDKMAYGIGEVVSVYSKPKVVSATVSVEGSDKDPWVFNKDSGEFPVNFIATEPGVYTISQEFSNTDIPKETKFFVHLDKDECNFGLDGGILSEDDGSQKADEALENSELFDMEDLTFYFAAAMLLLLLIEWGLQYREQY